MKAKKIIAIFLAVLCVSISFAGCGSSSYNSAQAPEYPAAAPAAASSAPAAALSNKAGFANDSAHYEPELALSAEHVEMRESLQDAEADMPEVPEEGGGIAGPTQPKITDSRKIIKNVDINLQTVTFDSGVESITKLADDFGGYIENSNIQGRDMYNERGARFANFTVRIPSERLDAFINTVGGEFHVISKSQNSQDITESYYDSRARLDALKVQEQRLLTMLEGANELEYMLQIEKELMNVRYEIESLTSSLNRLDNYVSLSTVNIYLNEVVKYEPVEDIPVTFGERVSRAFTQSIASFSEFMQDFTVGVISVLPFLLLLAAVVLVIVLIVRAAGKKAAAKRAKNPQAPAMYAPVAYNRQPYAPPEASVKKDDGENNEKGEQK